MFLAQVLNRLDTRTAEVNDERFEQLPPKVARMSGSAIPLIFKTISVPTRSYAHILTEFESSVDGSAMIVGGTGVGKSTFVMMQFVVNLDRTVLLIEPNYAIVGDVLNNFNKVMPAVNEQLGGLYGKIPHAVAIDLMTMAGVMPRVGELYVCTTASFVEYVRTYGAFPDYSTVALDEFQLVDSNMCLSLAMFKNIDYCIERILLTATVPGRKSYPPTSGDVTNMVIPNLSPSLPPSDLSNNFWDLSNLLNSTSATTAVFMPTLTSAEAYRDSLYNLESVRRVDILSSNTTMQQYAEIHETNHTGHVILMTPASEVGVTLPKLAYLVDPKLTNSIVMENNVVCETTRELTKTEATQRRGRAGRTIHTTYITPGLSSQTPESGVRNFYDAEALVLLRALGLDVSNQAKRLGVATKLFQILTPQQAQAAITDTTRSILIAAYRYDAFGRLYPECGGPGVSNGEFEKLYIDDMRVYKCVAPLDFFISPLLDLTNLTVSPADFLPDRQMSMSMNLKIVKKLGRSQSMADMLVVLEQSINSYILKLLESIRDAPALTDKTYSHPDGANCSYATLFTDPDLMLLMGVIEKYAPIKAIATGKMGMSGKKKTVKVYEIQIVSTYMGKTYPFGLMHVMQKKKKLVKVKRRRVIVKSRKRTRADGTESDSYTDYDSTSEHDSEEEHPTEMEDTGYYDVATSTKEYKRILEQIVALSVIVDEGSRVVDCSTYSTSVARSVPWYKSVFG
jgi:hypothetical protein